MDTNLFGENKDMNCPDASPQEIEDAKSIESECIFRGIL